MLTIGVNRDSALPKNHQMDFLANIYQNKTSYIISSDVEGLSSLSENRVLKQVIIAYWLSMEYGYEMDLSSVPLNSWFF